MRRAPLLLIATILTAKTAVSIEPSAIGPGAMPAEIAPIDAPFDMPALARPTIADRVARIEGEPRAGAIQPAIDRLAAVGGGRVVVPPGKWSTGRLQLRTGVELHLEEGAEVHFSGQIEDYFPPVFTRNEGLEMMGLGGLVFAHNAERIALTGKGVLVGPAEGPVREARKGLSDQIVDPESPVASRVFDGQDGRHYFRPYFVCPVACRDVLIEGVTLRNGPMWNVVPIYCDRVVVRGVTVHSVGTVNGDGFDVDSSRNVLIEYCAAITEDDCYAIKAGRNEDGLRVGRAAENIVIRHCYGEHGYGGVTVGSETAGGIRNVWVHDCRFDRVSFAAYFKTRRPRGGGGDNLLFERLSFQSHKHAIFFDMIGSPLYVGELGERLPKRPVGPATPHYRGVTLRDLTGKAGGDALKIKGIPESPAEDVRVERSDITSRGFVNLTDADRVTIRDSKVATEDPTLRLLDATRVTFENCAFSTPDDQPILVDQAGDASEQPVFIDCEPGLPLSER